MLATPAAGDNGGKLEHVQAQLQAARNREARLTRELSSITSDIRKLEARVGDVSQRLSVLEQDLELHQRRLEKLNALYEYKTDRLNILRRAYVKAVHELNLRMIDLYTTPDPTLVEVIIESDSFQDALNRIHYLGAIPHQVRHIAAQVRVVRDRVRVSREQTKKVRARVHSETQIVAYRTQQQRDARDQLLASPTGLSGTRLLSS